MFLRTIIIQTMLLASAEGTTTTVQHRANPIRKLVNMLIKMQDKVEAEKKKTQELFEKFDCYCKTTSSKLEDSIEEATDKIPQLESTIKDGTAIHAQLEGELVAHKTERAAAEEAIGKATGMRKKEAEAFAKESAEQKANLEAIGKAIPAIEKGMGGFLQTNQAARLRQITLNADLSSVDRQALASFLSVDQSQGDSDEGEEYSAGSGEILGILKQLKEEMEKDFADLTSQEDTAIAEFNDLVACKQQEIAAATKAIEEKTARVGELAVELATTKNDLEDTEEAMAEDEKLLAETKKTCEIKTKEHEAAMKVMGMELLALADTIKMLNDDDALDLFKKTLPAASAFIQLDLTSQDVREQALKVLRGKKKHGHRSLHLDFIALALRGRKAGFEKVVKMIDDMVILLGKEEKTDEKKKEYCKAEFDKTEDEQKVQTKAISDLEKAIAEQEDILGTLNEEIAALKKGIADLDTSVAVATEQRKEENAEFTENLASNNAAKELIEMAKNRMQKFYNPTLAKFIQRPAPRRIRAPVSEEHSDESFDSDSFVGGDASFVQIKAHTKVQTKVHAKTKDDIEDGRYQIYHTEQQDMPKAPVLAQSKKQDSGGVLAMMDSIIGDIDKEITQMTLEEKDSQEDYEATMKSAADKRGTDAKALGEKEAALAELEEESQKTKDAKAAKDTELAETEAYMADLHKECDWLLENFDSRKEARANEIDALKKAKDVLSGAFIQDDYSLVQTGVRRKMLRLPRP